MIIKNKNGYFEVNAAQYNYLMHTFNFEDIDRDKVAKTFFINSSWEYENMPTLSNLIFFKNTINSFTSSSVSPGKPAINVVRRQIPGILFLISPMISSISSRVICLFIAFNILLLACCSGISR